MLSDIEIAQGAKMLPIKEVAKSLDICEDDLEFYGKYKAKLSEELIEKTGAAGYEILIEPKDHTFPTEPPYSCRLGFCRGPVGEEVEFFELK